MDKLLPWLSPLWYDLNQRASGNTLPHALLFSGPRGYGKAALARQFAHGLLCQAPDEQGLPCGECAACHLLQAGTHPDYRHLTPEEEGKVIAVDRVRALGKFLALKGQYGNRQIVIIDPAEAMNRFAANSLLKTLEEPSEDALLILVSSRPSLLLPTIRSRCQQLNFPRPATDIALDWLKTRLSIEADHKTLLSLTDGAPLEALKLHESGALKQRQMLAQAWLELAQGRGDPLDCAALWSDIRLPQAMQWLASWTMDLIRLKSGAAPAVIVNCDLMPEIQRLAEHVDAQQLFAALEQITEYRRWADGQLNPQLVLEDIMINWRRLGSRQLARTRVESR